MGTGGLRGRGGREAEGGGEGGGRGGTHECQGNLLSSETSCSDLLRLLVSTGCMSALMRLAAAFQR
jgi:hypothetical protein